MSISSANRSLQLVMRLLDGKTATEPILDFGPQKPEIPLPHRSTSLPRQTPEEQGIPSRHIAAFLQALSKDPTLRMHSVLVLRNGSVLCEAAFGAQLPELPRMTFSACKSITALAIGILMDDGLLDAEDRLVDLFPEDCGPVSRRLMKDLTVEHLLSMQTGNLFNEASSMTEANWTRGYFLSPSLTDPRGKFQYNSLNSYILAVLVTRLTGMSLSDFLQKRLFGPMGIGDYYWETSPEGIEKGGWGLYMRAEDLGKLGQLVLNGGIWDGSQLISREFLTRATTVHSQVPDAYGDFHYGWQMWVGRQDRTVLFNGMLGQNVLCFRDSGIILVSHAGNAETFQQSHYFQIAAQYFGGTFPLSLPRDKTAQRALSQVLESLCCTASPLPSRQQPTVFDQMRLICSDARAASSGLLPLTLQAVENSYTRGLQAISLCCDRQNVTVLYEERDELHQIIAGTTEPTYQSLRFHGNEFRVAAQARFTHDDEENPVLRIQLDFLETPCTRILKIKCLPQGWVLQQSEFPSMDYLLDTMALSASAATKTLMNTLLGSSDDAFLHWKLHQLFDTTLQLTKA